MTQPKIIDVSAAQPLGSIDVAAAKADGVVGAIVRASYAAKIDAYFHKHIESFIAGGLRVGVYHFQYTDQDPQAEVAALANELRVAGYPLDYGVTLDVETLNHQSPGNVVTWASAFIDELIVNCPKYCWYCVMRPPSESASESCSQRRDEQTDRPDPCTPGR